MLSAQEDRFRAAQDDPELAWEADTSSVDGDVDWNNPNMRDSGGKVTLRIFDCMKPVIAAVNGYAMGGGFMLVERTDLRVASETAVFEVSEAKRWLLGGYNHGLLANVPHPIATEMALGFRFSAQRFYELGFLNRVVPGEQVVDSAVEMAEHMLTLPPAARVNTVHMMRRMRPQVAPPLASLADKLHDHGAKSDLMESRAAFSEKRKPNFVGWDDPKDRYNLPDVEQ